MEKRRQISFKPLEPDLSEQPILREVAGGDGEPVPGVCARLQHARLRAGYDLTDVANVLRIQLVHLEALEEGRFDDLPGKPYAVGFLRSYASFVGLDADEMVAAFKREMALESGQSELSFPKPTKEGPRPKPWLLLAVVALAGLAYGGWQLYLSDGKVATDIVADVSDRITEAAGFGDDEPVIAAPTSTDTSITAAATGEAASAVTSADRDDAVTVSETLSTETGWGGGSGARVVSEVAPSASAPGGAADPQALTAVREGAVPRPVQPPVERTALSRAEPPVTARAEPTPPAADPVVERRVEPPSAAAAPADDDNFAASTATRDRPAIGSVSSSGSSGSLWEASSRPTPSATSTQAAPVRSAPMAQETTGGTIAATSATEPSTPDPATPATATTPSSLRDTLRDTTALATQPAETQVALAEPAVDVDPNYVPQVYGGTNVRARVVITATADSWVQVQGPSNELLLTRILRAGDSYRVPNRSGLVMVTGNAGALDIRVDGRKVAPIGPVGVVRRNVALDPDRLSQGTAVRN